MYDNYIYVVPENEVGISQHHVVTELQSSMLSWLTLADLDETRTNYDTDDDDDTEDALSGRTTVELPSIKCFVSAAACGPAAGGFLSI